MKKLVVIALTLLLIGCSVDNDSQITSYELASITDYDLPDELVLGRTYDVRVGFVFPSDCNNFQALDARRAGTTSEERSQIYISVITAVVENNSCNRDVTGHPASTRFVLTVDEERDYTFRFWTGQDGDEPIYEEVTIPVVMEQS
ncbi:hypothetical protein [Christiangramia portivictoriae]|uniref:hypothetical protein n=1 Tax=Christiangramia portivictoriae TaxID=326069 RepID=UPI0004165F87|nr:hypothetical protein [Christiangramia portivictoriae]